MNEDKRLIEDYLPIEAISKEASREKSVRKGHISTLHLWWARRPLVACRTAVYGTVMLFLWFGGCASSDRQARLQQENASLRQGVSSLEREIDGLKADLQALADKDATAKRVLELRQSLHVKTAEHADAAKRLEESLRELEHLSTELDTARENNAKLVEENRKLRELTAEVNNPLVRVAIIEWKLVERLRGAALIAQNDDRTYLGVIDFAGTHQDSVFNEFGLYGSEVGLKSIWNDVGFYGSEVGLYSARNAVCINPPMLVKDRMVLGYVTTNRVYAGSPRFDPYYLRDLARRVQGKLGGQ